MAVKALFSFKDDQGYGWTEEFWWDNGLTIDPSSDVTDFMQFRIAFLSTHAKWQNARVSSPLARDPFFIEPPGGAPQAGVFAGNLATDFIALMVRLDNHQVGYNRKFFRGLPAQVITEDDFTPGPVFSSALAAFGTYLIQSGVWKIRSKLANSTARVFTSTMVPTPPRGYLFDAPKDSFNEGDFIYMSGATVNGYNGTKQIVRKINIDVTKDRYKVGGAAPEVNQPDTGTTYARRADYTFGNIDTADIEGITRRSPGRPFGQRRGRRQTQLSLRP